MSNQQDPKCGTCAYRVNELRRCPSPYSAGTSMVCLHPKIGRQDCKQARLSPDAKCGADAGLWAPHAVNAQQVLA